MIIELHMLQNFAPSNLNRDDTGSPKSADFGGYHRARISSQCLKRALRQQFKDANLIVPEARAVRTKRILTEVAQRLIGQGRDPGLAETVVTRTLGALEITVVARPDANADRDDAAARKEYFDDQKSQYLLYLGSAEIDRLAAFCAEHWDALAAVAAGGEAKGRDAKKAARDAAAGAISKAAVEALKKSLDGGRAADLALFGRMLADLPGQNIDAASQVAHAISTHEVGLEFDYYTAVDDLKPEDSAGADMIGTVEFNSACYYRYANIDLGQLAKNLGGDRDLLEATVRAFLLASRDAEPTGKQNTFAARNRPSFAFAVVRDCGCWSLANAFARPVRAAGRDDDIVAASVRALATHWGDLVNLYDEPAGAKLAACGLGSIDAEAFGVLQPHRLQSYREMVNTVLAAVQPPIGAA